jgi:hypothetical protein
MDQALGKHGMCDVGNAKLHHQWPLQTWMHVFNVQLLRMGA